MEIMKKPKIYAAFIVFAAAVLMLLFVAAPIQTALGTWGLVLTEIIIAVLAIISVYIFGYDLREALPVKVPKLRQVFGVLLLWAGALLVGLLASMFTMMLFPDDMYQLSKALGDFLTEGPLLLAFISASLFPAVCEEILCRGFMQYSLGGFRRQWLVIILVGVLFGMLHLSPYRIAPTMILGITLAYIMAVTKTLSCRCSCILRTTPSHSSYRWRQKALPPLPTLRCCPRLPWSASASFCSSVPSYPGFSSPEPNSFGQKLITRKSR
jgi:membrane protease YdiL (CAAX protease family)